MDCQRQGCNQPKQARGLCKRHYAEWYRQAHPDRVAASHAKRKDKAQEYHRNYYLANKDRILQKQAEMREANRDGYNKRNLERAVEWAKKNPEKARQNRRRYWAKKKYGLTLEEYDAIIARGCAICGLTEVPYAERENKWNGRLCLDHDHSNGKIRDALCKDCNVALGSMKDSPARLRKAANYLERHRKT